MPVQSGTVTVSYLFRLSCRNGNSQFVIIRLQLHAVCPCLFAGQQVFPLFQIGVHHYDYCFIIVHFAYYNRYGIFSGKFIIAIINLCKLLYKFPCIYTDLCSFFVIKPLHITAILPYFSFQPQNVIRTIASTCLE